MKDLKIGGELRNASGNVINFVRRKGSKNTLLKSDGSTLDDYILASFLHDVSKGVFKALFGINYQVLMQGGKEILEQKGEVAQTLYAAALGSQHLQDVLRTFNDDADNIFLPRGSKQKIGIALSQLNAIHKEIKEHTLSSNKWDTKRRELSSTKKGLDKVKKEQIKSGHEVNQMERAHRIIPKLSKRKDLVEKRENLGNVTILDENFSEHRRESERKLENAKALIDKATLRLKNLSEQKGKLLVNQDLLNQEESIKSLHEKLKAYRDARRDRPKIESDSQRLLNKARNILDEIRPDVDWKDVKKLRPLLARRKVIDKMKSENDRITDHLESTENNFQKKKSQLNEVENKFNKLQEPKSIAKLSGSMSLARKDGDTDLKIQDIHNKLTSLQTECEDSVAQLTLWNGKLEQVTNLPVPSQENINIFDSKYGEVQSEEQRFRSQLHEVTERLTRNTREIDELKNKLDVPTENALKSERNNRDGIWKLLRSHWIDGENISQQAKEYESEGKLHEAFESKIAKADEVSDRLRLEADRVQKLAQLEAEQESLRVTEKQANQGIERANAEKEQIDSDWKELWFHCDIVPQSPKEMRNWLDRFTSLRSDVAQLKQLKQEVAELEKRRTKRINDLNRQMKNLDHPVLASEKLETLLSECERVEKQLTDERHRYESLDSKIQDERTNTNQLKKEHEDALEKNRKWEEKWLGYMEELGLKSDTIPEVGVDFLERLQTLFDGLKETDDLDDRLQKMDSTITSFQEGADHLVKTLMPELRNSSPDDAVVHLNSAVTKNRDRQAESQQIDKSIKEAKVDIKESESTIRDMEAKLADLCDEAKVADKEQLEPAERKSKEFLEIISKIETLDEEILSEGSTVAEFEEGVSEMDFDLIPAQIKALKQKINDELDPRQTELTESKGRIQSEFEGMNGKGDAAQLADEAQSILASIRSDAEEYARMKLAAKILQDQIERYRQENQGPLLKRASEYFSTLTLESFTRLTADFDQNDRPVLIGVKSDEAKVPVDGMSEGTRAQLYLALRLASLERYMESSEPMPFIVDDILVDFDDDRSQAALEVLSELAQKTQVILFTHHSKIREQSGKLSRNVQVIELE